MKDRCPNCKTKINMGKEKLIDCPYCNKKLLLVTINAVKQLFDVTPEELKNE